MSANTNNKILYFTIHVRRIIYSSNNFFVIKLQNVQSILLKRPRFSVFILTGDDGNNANSIEY